MLLRCIWRNPAAAFQLLVGSQQQNQQVRVREAPELKGRMHVSPWSPEEDQLVGTFNFRCTLLLVCRPVSRTFFFYGRLRGGIASNCTQQ